MTDNIALAMLRAGIGMRVRLTRPAAALLGVSCPEPVEPEAPRPILPPTTFGGPTRLPAGLTEGELLHGYQHTRPPAQGWSDAGNGKQLLPVRSADETGGDESRSTCIGGSVTSPARADSLP